MKNSSSLVLGVVVLATVGCGLVKEVQNGPVTGRDGVWSTACYAAPGGRERDLLAVTGSEFALTNTKYLDTSCASPWIGTRVAFSSRDGSPSTVAQDAKEIDLTVVRVELAAFDATYAKLFSDQSYCGFNGWVAGEYKDVTGKNCGGVQIMKSGTTLYDVYLLDTKAGTLQTGKRTATNDGSSTLTRPRELDVARTFRRPVR